MTNRLGLPRCNAPSVCLLWDLGAIVAVCYDTMVKNRLG